jgi:hypothetical protein
MGGKRHTWLGCDGNAGRPSVKLGVAILGRVPLLVRSTGRRYGAARGSALAACTPFSVIVVVLLWTACDAPSEGSRSSGASWRASAMTPRAAPLVAAQHRYPEPSARPKSPRVEHVVASLRAARVAAASHLAAGRPARAHEVLEKALAVQGAYPMSREEQHIEVYYETLSDFMEALLAAGRPARCLERGKEALGAYPQNPLEMIRDQPMAQRIEHLMNRCQNRWDATYARDASTPCARGRMFQGVCYTYHPGTFHRDGAELDKGQRRSRGLDPFLRAVPESGEHERLAFRDGALSNTGSCGGELKAIWREEGAVHLRIGGPFHFCWEGTAAWEVDAVYRLEGGHMTLIEQVVAVYH